MSSSTRDRLAIVILAAGKGKRMKSDRPKVMFDLAGWPLVRHVVETALKLRPERVLAVVGHGRAEVAAALEGTPAEIVVQREQRGTGHAVRCAQKALGDFEGTLLVLLGDVPLVTPGELRSLCSTHRRKKAAVTVLTTEIPDPKGYGRILRGKNGRVTAIREHKDATAAERAVNEVNTGIMAFRTDGLWTTLSRLKADNTQGEYYLTDVPRMLLDKGERVESRKAKRSVDVLGINSMADLADISTEARRRILADHMGRGVRIVDPGSTYVDRAVKIGKGTTIFPFTVITGEVTIGRNCEVGPFSHLRTGATLKDGAQVGNFVEVKKSIVGKGTKAKHLTYLGDAVIGAGANIGCGTITANYDGKNKHRTTIGDGVHVGSGTIFVAPVKIGRGAVTGAGSVVPAGRDVGEGETVIGVPARVLRTGKEKR